MSPGSVDDVLEQAAVKSYRHLVVIGADEDGEVYIHSSEWPEDAQYLVKIASAVLQMLMTPNEDLARA